MDDCKKNVYDTRTMIGNWVEERATREQVIKQYLELKAKGDIKAMELEADLNNIMKPVKLSSGPELMSGDTVVLLIHAPAFAMCISHDVRYPNFDWRQGSVCSLSAEIKAKKRHTFTIRKIQSFGYSKMGRRTQTISDFTGQQICQGDKFVLVIDKDMVEYATGKKQDCDWVLGCPKVPSSPLNPVVIGPQDQLG